MLNDIYMLTDVQNVLAQELLNVYFYQQITSDGDGDDLAAAFFSDVLPEIKAVQQLNLIHTRLDTFNITDGLTFTSLVLSGEVGLRVGDSVPSFTAYGFRLSRTNALTRNGSKRIGGVSEADITGNLALPGMVPLLQSAAFAMGDQITGGFPEAIFIPVIVKRPIIVGGVNLINPVTSGVYQRVTSQVSRKATL